MSLPIPIFLSSCQENTYRFQKEKGRKKTTNQTKKTRKNSQGPKCVGWFQASLEHPRKNSCSWSTHSRGSSLRPRWEQQWPRIQLQLAGSDQRPLPEGTGRNGPRKSNTQVGEVPHHFPTVSRPSWKVESPLVLKLYQRVGVQLFSISPANGTEQLPLEWREGNLDIKRHDQL